MDYSSILAGDIKVYEWDWEPTQLLDTFDTDKIQETLDRVNKLKIHWPDFTELQFLASTQGHYLKDSNGLILSLLSTATLVIVALIMSFAILGCYRRWRWKPIHNENELAQHCRGWCCFGCCFPCCRSADQEPLSDPRRYRGTGFNRASIPQPPWVTHPEHYHHRDPAAHQPSRAYSELLAQQLAQDVEEEMQELRSRRTPPHPWTPPPAFQVAPPAAQGRPPSTTKEALARLVHLTAQAQNLN